ncbi:MAG: YggS family pyridoxal phosphate-dependent enzyme [Clostridiales bacterium]|nr:YggS family pyridoxal phosphate-dependent enzyme [Clostridiales bacterium]
MTIYDRVAEIRERIALACARCGRRESEVTLIAVAKYVAQEQIAEAILSGICHFGENHAQEVVKKLNFYKHHACDLHFIGHLQTNKIKYVCGNADLIQSVDRLSLARGLAAQADLLGIDQSVLVQVNVGAEPQKGGVLPNDLPALLEQLAGLPRLKVCGLMSIPPVGTAEETRKYFISTRALLEENRQRFPELPLAECSMGMSADYEVAIEEGATMVRVGTSLFGARQITL